MLVQINIEASNEQILALALFHGWNPDDGMEAGIQLAKDKTLEGVQETMKQAMLGAYAKQSQEKADQYHKMVDQAIKQQITIQ